MTVQTPTLPPSRRDAAVTVVLASDRDAAFVRVSGDIDLSDSPTLAGAHDLLVKARPDAVWLDLADVTFAGSTLMNFLLRLRNAMAEETRFVVCRPTQMALRVLTVCHLESRMEIIDRRPDDWPPPGTPALPL